VQTTLKPNKKLLIVVFLAHSQKVNCPSRAREATLGRYLPNFVTDVVFLPKKP
jgi:hypothetical protein